MQKYLGYKGKLKSTVPVFSSLHFLPSSSHLNVYGGKSRQSGGTLLVKLKKDAFFKFCVFQVYFAQ
jgi:hypothetical protein